MLFSNYQDDMRFLNAMDSIANSLALIAEHTKSTQENEARAQATQKQGMCQDDVEYWCEYW
jgi:hypothetical protein